MNLNFKVPTWDFIITDPSSPKVSSPKVSSPKTSSPKISSPKTSSPKACSIKNNNSNQNGDSVYNNQINLSGSPKMCSSPRFINETGKPVVKKTPSKTSVVPSSSGSTSPVLKMPFSQQQHNVPQQQLSNSQNSSPVLLSQPIQDLNAPNVGYKLELEQRLHKRQLHKMLEKQIQEKQHQQLGENEKKQLLLQQQQIQQQQQQIQQQQQQIQQLQQFHQQQIQQQQHLFYNNTIINNNNSSSNSNNIIIKNETSAPISLPPLPATIKSITPTCDVFLKSSSPSSPSLNHSPLTSSPSFQNVPSVESHFINNDNYIQLPPIRDEIF